MSKASPLRRFFGALWRGITRLRLALSNILFLLVLVLIYKLFSSGSPAPLPNKAALLLNPMGMVVDQRSPVDPLQAIFSESSPASHEVALQDLLDAIYYAADDPAINSLVLELDSLLSVGISKTTEITEALEVFRLTGKPILARGDYFTQDQYLLASQADTVILHPYGAVALEGFSSYRNYYQEALEKLSVNVHVFKAGEHKSIAEPFLRNDMSEDEQAITLRWLDQLWGQFTEIVEQRRQLTKGAVTAYVNEYAQRLAEQGGDAAQAALQAGLVDQLLNHQASNDYLAEVVGARNNEQQYEAVPFEHYLARKRPMQLSPSTAERVAVLMAEGNIVPGEQPPGTIGGDSLAAMIRHSAKREGVKALVLRINSGGGSVFASEVIRQAVLSVQADGMPVVVSMGSVAASGGYYVAASADRIFATPATITGSIGVFAAIPTFENLMARLGVHTDGVGTTDLAGSLRVDRALNEQLAEALTSSVRFTYNNFLALVAEGRDMSVEQVDRIAQGRVWSASDALERGLIDDLGSLKDAVATAGELAGLEDFEVEYVRQALSAREMLLQQLTQNIRLPLGSGSTGMPAIELLLRPLNQAAALLDALRDPAHLYMHCVACSASQ
ncbi:signal peptide peptidase SppA [Parahaliea sp. F7430]|uniref:Signal peptide peptidase SppA n=1 Tax=Sediminihaliea albiluteola TaxID=2758564 RepID=A0A7W2TVL6_9GAMM|nr:signal peptide peptidase SppA [Sediminihaliea albiluteola]MBA6412785.1 signal peptide peptidase SppA [Sediminihaliea albiluteola]